VPVNQSVLEEAKAMHNDVQKRQYRLDKAEPLARVQAETQVRWADAQHAKHKRQRDNIKNAGRQLEAMRRLEHPHPWVNYNIKIKDGDHQFPSVCRFTPPRIEKFSRKLAIERNNARPIQSEFWEWKQDNFLFILVEVDSQHGTIRERERAGQRQQGGQTLPLVHGCTRRHR